MSIDKSSSNFTFICRKFYIFKLLAEISLNKMKHSTSAYSQTKKFMEELVKTNIKYCKKFDPKIIEED